MRRILEYILKILAKIVLRKYKPEIVAITGSVGKTSTKEAIYQVLRKKFRTRRNIKNYNNEIGLPLTILGLETGGRSLIAWLKNFLKAIPLFFSAKDYPEILVLEMGVDRPGDMKYLLSFVPVKIGVLTAIGQYPVHSEFFSEREELIREKALLVKSLPKKGLAVINYDDPNLKTIIAELIGQIKIIDYGFNPEAKLKITNYELKVPDLEKGNYGISFKLEYQGSIVPIRLNKVLGKQQAAAAAAAAAVGIFFGLNLVDISTAFNKYRSLAGRGKLIKGIKNTFIIDDSYNASPLATLAALELLEEFASVNNQSKEEPKSRKIAVLGDMLELGQYTEAGHRQVGEKAALTVDKLFTVGERARFISDQAKQHGLAQKNIFEFDAAEQVGKKIQDEIKTGDIILVKGSRSMRLEKVVEEIMAQPEKADKLLVR